jgi:flagellar basal body-associated protein FliL
MSDKAPHTPAKPAASATADEMAHAESLLGGAKKEADGHGKVHDEKSGGTKKKKGKGKSGPSLSSKISKTVKSWRDQFFEIFRGLRSPDGPTQRMSIFFFLSLFALAALGAVAIRRSIDQKRELRAQIAAAKEEETEKNHEASLLGSPEAASEGAHATSMLDLGAFTIELKPVAGQPKKKGGFMNMAEVELVIECDSKETHDFIEENLVQVRSQVTDIFLSMDREELLSREGKRKLKKRLIERLNGWIPRGKVQNAFFSKLVVA